MEKEKIIIIIMLFNQGNLVSTKILLSKRALGILKPGRREYNVGNKGGERGMEEGRGERGRQRRIKRSGS